MPRASAVAQLDPRYFRGLATLGDVDARLSVVLERIGYSESGRYTVPGGFVLVTRMERIYPDGRPWPSEGRFAIDDPLGKGFSLGDYLRALFTAHAGQYRVLAFVVSNRTIVQAAQGLTGEQATALVADGGVSLPEADRALLFTPQHRVVALIYEFQRPAGRPPAQRTPSGVQGLTHLRNAGIIQALTE